MLLIRKILFWILTAVFIVVCPLLILYAMGYIYNPVRQQFVQTGIIRLASMPSGADIFLETSRFEKQTPANLTGVLPGEYRITLRKKGFRPWSHTIRVEPGKAAAFDNILLIPDQWPTKVLSQAEYEKLIPLGNRYLFLVARNSNLGSYYVFDRNKQLQPLLNTGSLFGKAAAANIYHAAKSGAMIVEDGSFWSRKYLYLNIEEIPSDVNDITDLFKSKPAFISWDVENPLRLYAGGGGCINLIDIKAKKSHPCYLKDVRGFGIYDKDIYILDANSAFWRMSADKKKQECLSVDVHLAKQLFEQSDFYEISVSSSGITLFLGTGGDLVSQRPPYHISDNGIVGFEFSNNRNMLLYWSKKSIGLADFSSQNEKGAFQAAFRVQTLYTKATNIRQCLWAYKNSHILYSDDDVLYLLELEPQGQPHVEQAAKIRKGTDVMYAPASGVVYYLDSDSGKLEELRIIPGEALPLIGFIIQD